MECSEKTMEAQDFEKILADGDRDELNELKAWLFKENIRLQAVSSELKQMEDRLYAEQKQFQTEVKEINHRLNVEQKRLKQNEDFFEKKISILKNGFAQLDADRKKFERDKLVMESERNAYAGYAFHEKNIDMAEMLFQGVNSYLTLKKRYRDLIKMFHPDNLAGDHEMILLINKIYEELRQDYEMGKRA